MKNYKTIWDDLSLTFADAAYVVGLMSEEDEIRRNGQITTDFLRSALHIQPTDKVLEIGCGIARIGRELAPYCGEWHGSDISGNMIEFAARRTEGLPNVYLHELPEPNLSIFNDNSFDKVYSTIVFMHLDKVEMFNYMREAYRVLAPGGEAYFDTYNITSPVGWQQFMTIIETFPLGERPGHVSQFSTKQEVVKFMTEAGFAQVEVDDTNDTLVVTRAMKPEQADFQRPENVLNLEAVARAHALKMATEEEYRRERLEARKAREMPEYEDWLQIRENIDSKNAYITQLETTLANKDRHIATLEKRLRKQDRQLRALPVRLALRLSKPR